MLLRLLSSMPGKLKSMLLTLTLLLSLSAAAEHLPQEDYQLIGSGELKFLFLKIYQAELYAPAPPSGLEAPMLLQINYLRAAPTDRIAKVTFEEMAKQAYASAEQIETWQPQYQQLLPTISAGDSLSFHYRSETEANFYFNHQLLGSIDDPDFARAFLAIWLAPTSSQPELRDALLGR